MSDKDYTGDEDRRKTEEQKKRMMKPPQDLDKPQGQKYGQGDGAFGKAWDDLIKFGDCPVCHGDPMACPEPDKPASLCSRRRNAIKHMRRGRGSIRIPE